MKRIYFLIFVLCFILKTNAQSYKEEIISYREEYKRGFMEDERSPIKERDDLQFLKFFDVDETYRVTAKFELTENAKPFNMPTMNGSTKEYVEYGKATFKLNNKSFTLTLYQGIALLANPEYKDHLFLPFLDETNGNETYGGGRYLDFKTGDIQNNELIIDFNKAYNPYCAFAGGYRCPKPPEENNLKIEILAGEKKFAKEHH